MSGHPAPAFASDTRTDSLLNVDEWKLLVQGARQRHLEPGETVFRQGDVQQRLFQIVNGSCLVVLEEADAVGPARPIATMEHGEIFGEISFLVAEPASATVVAGPDGCTVVVMEGYFIASLMQVKEVVSVVRVGRFQS